MQNNFDEIDQTLTFVLIFVLALNRIQSFIKKTDISNNEKTHKQKYYSIDLNFFKLELMRLFCAFKCSFLNFLHVIEQLFNTQNEFDISNRESSISKSFIKKIHISNNKNFYKQKFQFIDLSHCKFE